MLFFEVLLNILLALFFVWIAIRLAARYMLQNSLLTAIVSSLIPTAIASLTLGFAFVAINQNPGPWWNFYLGITACTFGFVTLAAIVVALRKKGVVRITP